MRIVAIMITIILVGILPAKMKGQSAAEPHVIVYKTKKNYNKNVPVILSYDKSKIVSYPDPSDVRTDNGYAVPTKLKHGYLLDNRGIGLNVAFLKLTYNEYAALHQAPSLDSMYNMIIDKDPLLELYDCGSRYEMVDPVKEINELIKKGELRKNCKVVK